MSPSAHGVGSCCTNHIHCKIQNQSTGRRASRSTTNTTHMINSYSRVSKLFEFWTSLTDDSISTRSTGLISVTVDIDIDIDIEYSLCYCMYVRTRAAASTLIGACCSFATDMRRVALFRDSFIHWNFGAAVVESPGTSDTTLDFEVWSVLRYVCCR